MEKFDIWVDIIARQPAQVRTYLIEVLIGELKSIQNDVLEELVTRELLKLLKAIEKYKSNKISIEIK